MLNNRNKRSSIAKETLEILEKGFYVNLRGEKVEFGETVKYAVQNAVLYSPEKGTVESQRCKAYLQTLAKKQTKIEVTNESTLHAVKRLLDEGCQRVAALNFASAKNPGGGFLGGSQAQEESLARASGLYPTIAQMREMYETNQRTKTCLYTDYMIYSPDVPVFRNDADELLQQPYAVSFITAPAVNAGVVRERESQENIQRIPEVMMERIDKILSIAVLKGHENIVLGAYGCGVFRNNPAEVVMYFKELLETKFLGAFEQVVFAVLDRSKSWESFYAFQKAFKNI